MDHNPYSVGEDLTRTAVFQGTSFENSVRRQIWMATIAIVGSASMMAWAVLGANGNFDWTFDLAGLFTAASMGTTIGILNSERFSKAVSVKGVAQNLEQEQVNMFCQDYQQHLLWRCGLLTAAVWCNSIAADNPRAIPSILSALALLLVMILRLPTRRRIEKWVLFRLEELSNTRSLDKSSPEVR